MTTLFTDRDTTITAAWLNSVANVIELPGVSALAGITPSSNQLPYYISGTAAALTQLTAFARTLLDDTTSTQALSTLGAQTAHANLAALAGLTGAADKLPYFTGVGAMSLTTLTSYARGILAATDSASFLATLDAELQALAAVTSAADQFPYFTGSGVATTTTVTAAARTVLDDATVAAMLATMGGAPLASPTFTGTVTLPIVTLSNAVGCANNSINAAKSINFNAVVDDSTSGTSKTIDFTTGQYHKLSMTGNCTITLTAPAGPCVVQLQLTQDGTGGRTYTTSPVLKWPGSYSASDKLLSTAINTRDLLILRWDGTDYVANLIKAIA